MAKGTLRKSVKRDVSSQSPPYTMEKLDARDAQRVGNDRYEGFVVDLIHAVAEIVGFNVRMYHCTLQSKFSRKGYVSLALVAYSEITHFCVHSLMFCLLFFWLLIALGCTIAAVSVERPVEHVKTALQNIMTEWKPKSVERSVLRGLSYKM